MDTTATIGFYFFRSMWNRLSRPLMLFIPLLALNFSIPLIRLSARNFYILDKTVDIMVTISFADIMMGLVKVAEDYVVYHYDLKKTNNLKERKIRTQLQFLRNVFVAIIVIITICIILLSFENLRKIGTGLLTGVGVGGIIIGFAAQRSLGNLLAGFQIAFTQPLRIDDVLVVEGEWGRVEDITLTYVVLSIWDQRRLILPINYFIEKPFQNWTRISAEILGTVFLYLDYTIPIGPLRVEFTRLLNACELWDKRVGIIQVTNLSERTIELRALVSAENSARAFDLRCHIRENLISFIQQHYPQSLPRERMEWRGKQEAGPGA